MKSAEEVHRLLCEAGVDAALYHGRVGVKERKRNQEEFMNGARRMMVATNAFGMGIDKADVRAIVRYQMPGSLEGYYQESGRAGRDGADAYCTLLYDLRDKRVQQFFLVRRYPTDEEIGAVHTALQELKANETAVQFVALREHVSALAANKLEVGLKLLKDAGAITQQRGRAYRLLQAELSRDELERFAREYRERGERDREKLERMVFYAQSALCR